MVYNQANQILGCALTPNNRGICKKTAILWHADPTPLANFVDNRLLPVTTGYVKLQEFTIRFMDYDGTVLQTRSIPYGTVPTYTGSTTPSRTGYHWNNGWTPTIVAATANADYTATFDINQYTVTFISDGSTYDTQYVNHGGHASVPAGTPTKAGFTFAGWSPDVASTTITGNTTFTAQWTVSSHTVTYNIVKDGQTTTTSETVSHGGTPSNIPSTPAIADYTGSWSPSNPSGATINSDTTFTYTYTYTGPSVTGTLVVQGGFDDLLPWKNDQSGETDEECDYWPSRLVLFPGTNQTRLTGRITVTGYKYNFYTKTRTNLPSGCYIDFANVAHSVNNYDETGVTITLSDALIAQGWRLSKDLYPNMWYDSSVTSNTYHYTGAKICSIGVPGGTPEDLWFVTLTTSDATLHTYYVGDVNHTAQATIDGVTYATYFITDSCYASERHAARTSDDYSYLDDNNLPITSTGTSAADENNYAAVLIQP